MRPEANSYLSLLSACGLDNIQSEELFETGQTIWTDTTWKYIFMWKRDQPFEAFVTECHALPWKQCSLLEGSLMECRQEEESLLVYLPVTEEQRGSEQMRCACSFYTSSIYPSVRPSVHLSWFHVAGRFPAGPYLVSEMLMFI